MSEVAIRVEGLGKQYRIGRTKRSHDTLRDQISDFGVSIFDLRKRLNGRNHGAATSNPESAGVDGQSSDIIWALKDVSFEVGRGEVVGIIGRNGAGKSTLLKILSRITEPTTGTVDLFGRVGSLLEVGTGFHPELTGRENIFLNGAILGMRRAEIAKKFDEIVAFAEVEKFIDTPVKRYSSGMYVRLAFAVAAHLEPEILLVDEVLAVGDAAFQKKCLGKMGDVAREGRTVLFVSHNMAAVGRMCTRAFWLHQGCLNDAGDTQDVMRAYLASADSVRGQIEWNDLARAPGDEFVRLTFVQVLDIEEQPNPRLYQDEPFKISIGYCVSQRMMNANVGFEISDANGTVVFASFDADNPIWSGRGRAPGQYVSECIVPAHLLNEGSYFLTVLAGIPHQRVCFRMEDVLELGVDASIWGGGPSGRMGARRAGLIAPQLEWAVKTSAAQLLGIPSS